MAEAIPANKSKPSKDTDNSNNKLSEDTVTGNNSTNNEPIIEYFGEGANKVKFTVEPNATLIRVYADGRILIDY